MTRSQALALNIVSALLIFLLFAHLAFSRSNSKLGNQLNAARAQVNNARQLQPVLENLVRRIAAGGEKDVQVKALLTKYDIKINAPGEAKPVDAAKAKH